jgi:dienelactone hydrolase
LSGDWVGEIRLGEEVTLLKLRCRQGPGGVRVAADLPPFGPADVALDKLRVGPAAVQFELPGDGGARLFEGQFKDGAVSGEVRHGPNRGTFRLVHLAAIDHRRLAACRGAYRVGTDRFIWVAPFGELGGGLFFLDSSSGRFGPLHAESDTTFFSGQAVVAPLFPPAVRIAFDRKADGAVSGLRYSQGKSDEVVARKVPLRREEVRFHNGEVNLRGTLTSPQQGGPHPAVVLVHGSGPEDRDFLGPWVEFFASRGVAALAYDKRGVGESGGDWKKATFADLAGDAVAAVRLLRGRADIDARRIGFFGISQGGWVAPLAARRAGNIAFLILHAGAAVSVAEQGLQSLEQELRVYGFPQAEIDEAIAYQKRDDAFTRTGQGWDQLQEAYRKAMAHKAEWVWPPRPKDDWFRPFYRGIMDHDPLPDLARLSCPVLAFFGEVDRTVPAGPNKTALQRALAKASDRDHTVVVLPRANHMFLEAQTGVRTEYPRLKNFVPAYFEMMARWLGRQVLAGR